MNFSKLIINNVRRSSRTYGGYFLSSAFSVFVFFIFSMLTFHPQLSNGLGGHNEAISGFASFGMAASQILIVLLSFIFLWYSFGIFSKARKKDLSLYMTLGMRPADLRRLLFGENILIGFSAILTGISLGLIFMKVILLLFQDILRLNKGLNFYFPVIAIALTFGVYLLLFLLVSAFLTFKIEVGNLTELGKSNETPEPLPKTHPLLVVLAFVFLLIGYGSLVVFVTKISSLPVLILCVLATVLGTFLFFHQVSVYYYLFKQRRPSYWRGKNLLLTSQGIYRAKENANLFALIACTAAVALVGVSVTAAFGSAESNNKSTPRAAFILSTSANLKNKEDVNKFTIGEETYQSILDADYDASYEKVMTRHFFYTDKEDGGMFFTTAMTFSDYQRLAKQLGFDPITMEEDQIFMSAENQVAVESMKNSPQKPIEVRIGSDLLIDEDGNFTDEGPIYQLETIPVFFGLNPYDRFSIVPDNFFDRPMFTELEENYVQVYEIIHFDNWLQASDLSETIIEDFDTVQNDVYEAYEQLYEDYDAGKIDDDAYEEQIALNSEKNFQYTSLYKNWREKRQANGFILLIGFLIGGVFFIFTSSILYFRLFGDLDKEAQYHRHLYNIGLLPKVRNQIIIRQLITMYFLPLMIAMIHSAVAFWGVVFLAGMNLWHYFFIIIATYFGLQLLLFSFSCWRYLSNLEIKLKQI